GTRLVPPLPAGRREEFALCAGGATGKKAGSRSPSSGPHRRTRRPFARHAERLPRGISSARARGLRATTGWKASTLAVRFLPNHNIQNPSHGAIRILRSNCFFPGTLLVLEEKVE